MSVAVWLPPGAYCVSVIRNHGMVQSRVLFLNLFHEAKLLTHSRQPERGLRLAQRTESSSPAFSCFTGGHLRVNEIKYSLPQLVGSNTGSRINVFYFTRLHETDLQGIQY